jgi:hypothetical protein
MDFINDEDVIAQESRRRLQKERINVHNSMVKKRLKAVDYDFERGVGLTRFQIWRLEFLDSIGYAFDDSPMTSQQNLMWVKWGERKLRGV